MFDESSYTNRDRRNLNRSTALTILWLIALVVCGLLFNAGYLPEGAISWVVALVPSIAGVLVIWSYILFIRGADELQRAIQLNALALSFGVTVVSIISYPALMRAGAPELDPNFYAAGGVLLYLSSVSYAKWRWK